MTVQTDDRLINIDIMGALRRRKWYGIIVAVIGIGATYGVVKQLPSIYRSTSTIMIEEPDVPSDLVKSTVSTYANDRLQIIQQRVMTSQHLNEVIDRFGLYPELQAVMPRSSIIQMMRGKVTLSVVSANLGAPGKKQQGQATIAFTLSFDHPNPNIAQQVANRLTDLYLAENNRSRQEKAAGTTVFLAEQAEKLSGDVTALEQRLLDLKSKYSGSLPEQFNFNSQMLSQAQAQLVQNRSDLQILNDRRTYIQTQLSQVSPYTAVTAEGRPMTPQAQLMALELQRGDLTSRYGEKHPEVLKLERQIQSLRKQLGGVDTAQLDRVKFDALQSQLNEALQRYGSQHPDVLRMQRQLEEMSAAAAAAPQVSQLTSPQGPPDNPFYLQLQGQLAEVTAQITAINTRNASIEANIAQLQERILQTPAIEAEYNSLKEQHAAALQRYQSFKDKEADAQVAETMEMQSKGETFSVIESPQYPDIPVSPNRKLLYAAGAFLSLMLGAALMLGLDLLDSRIYDAKALVSVFGEAPLATVPYINTRSERQSRLRVAGVASLVILIVVLIGSFMAARYLPMS